MSVGVVLLRVRMSTGCIPRIISAQEAFVIILVVAVAIAFTLQWAAAVLGLGAGAIRAGLVVLMVLSLVSVMCLIAADGGIISMI